MKKVICMIQALILCVLLIVPAFAEEGVFVPSITYKDGIEIVSAELNGEDVLDCLIVTSIAGAQAGETDITQAERDLLLELYAKLEDGSKKLPVKESEYVIRDLVDISFKKTACVDAGHNHESALGQDGASISITFKLNVEEGSTLYVYTYVNGEWVLAENVINKGDGAATFSLRERNTSPGEGTVTCTFTDIGPVAFCIAREGVEPPAPDFAWGWLVVLVAAAGAFILVFFLWIKRNKDKDGKEEIKKAVNK